MATNPHSDISTGQEQMSPEEGWELLFSLYGSAREALAEVGGADEWIRVLRDERSEISAN